eukprot:CAMPEP_0172082146 /NCGR_PEP_ID=MMETSP1043-20130122/19695_1 /TAXON_ID=464988 /ORGANISM="Hemiselmis andersenii, Strain CCMP441" /LENGTH=61 /DNA_ID=CAMNT_0012743665 /DNA_START=146 /DNA_END=328 /DNA_ORIENTATION=+
MAATLDVHSVLNARLPRVRAACPHAQSLPDSRRDVTAQRSSAVCASLSTAWSDHAQFPMAQ